MLHVIARISVFCLSMVLFYPEAKSESCFKSICEFTLVVTNSRSMSFKHDVRHVYDVELQQNGRLSLATNRFHLKVPNITLSPDMVHTADGTKARNIILVNDRFPGPTLEIMEGSEIAVKVINQLQFEGISIHWHGIHLLNNVWMDGVPYLTQCPILPRQSFMYRFRANPGTHFYHSHNELQRLDGLFGGLIVHRQDELGLMPYFTAVLSDWFPVPSTDLQILNPFAFQPGSATRHFNSGELMGVSVDGVPVTVFEFWSGLINGRGRKDNNTAPLTVFTAEQGNTHRMHIVSAAGDFAYRVSIDEHALTVIETDGHRVEAVKNFESVIIYPGERYVVEFQANREPGTRYWIRARSLRRGQARQYPMLDGIIWEMKAILQYGNKSTNNQDPVSKRMNCSAQTPCNVLNCPWPEYRKDFFPHEKCMNVAALRANTSRVTARQQFVKLNNNTEVDEEIFLNMAFSVGPSINRRRNIMPSAPLYQDPSSWALKPCEGKYGLSCSHIINLQPNKTVQLVLTGNIFSGFLAHHNMHIHGHSLHVLKIGYPIVDNVTGSIIKGNMDLGCHKENDTDCIHPFWINPPDLNFDNPPLKDTIAMPTRGYVVLRFVTNNPGFWLFHCHTATHNFEGMSLIFNISFDHHPPLPSGFPTCGNFAFSQDDFKKSEKNETKENKSGNCDGKDSKKDGSDDDDDDLSLVETLSKVAASCSAITVFLQLIFLVLLLKIVCRALPKVANTNTENSKL